MSEGECSSVNTSEIESELYFLVTKFLASGPCKKAAEALQNEIEEHGLFSKRLDWLGHNHDSSYANLERNNQHINGDHLVRICERLGPLLDKEFRPRVPGVRSLLATGRQSLLRTHKDVKGVVWLPSVQAALIHRHPIYPPCKLARTPNICHVVRGRELSGRALQSLLVPLQRYSSQICLFLRTLGHLSSVYCVAFDRSGTRIFTGADDHLVKVWCVHDGRLLATMRGHSSEIVDMNVNYENTLLAAGSIDKVIRVWNIQTLAPVAVLSGHTAMITSLEFSPFCRGVTRYMATTSSDGNVCLWQWNVSTNVFNPRPIKFQERSRAGAQMLCLSFSPGGVFLATGSSDPLIRVYMFTASGPERLCELEAHSDRVDSIDFCHSGDMFVSGSKDGTARVWKFDRLEWKSLTLHMSTRVPGAKTPGIDDANKVMKHRVTMVGWDLLDRHVVTAVNDHSLRVWDSHSGKLVHELYGHTDEVFVLECHPNDPRIFLSAGHDGLIIIWDLTTGTEVFRHHNIIEGQGHGAVFDCKFSPDGDFFAATDSHGHLSLFGWGPRKEKGREREHKVYSLVPYEQFFHTDYRPLMRDANNFVLDEQTQQAPHLMPPPFLVDMDGNPHPPYFQRLVPGRENMQTSSLIPEMGVAPNGINEVLSDPIQNDEQQQQEQLQQEEQQLQQEEQQLQQERIDEDNQAASILDEMIARMQQEQDAQLEGAAVEAPADDAALMPPPNIPGLRPGTPGRDRSGGPLSPSASPRGLRRSGEIEGVRQPVGNVPVSQPASQDDLLAWSRRMVTPMLRPGVARNMESQRHRFAEVEMAHFKLEKKKKRAGSPLFTTTDDDLPRARRQKKKDKTHGYKTRANQEEEEEEETVEDGGMSGAETSEEEIDWHSTSESGSESSQYSDWTADAGINLEPPKRNKRRNATYRKVTYSSGSEEEEPGPSKPKKKSEPRKRKIKPPPAVAEEPAQISECPEDMKPSPWITDVIPRKCPYVPQMGDELVYLRQGHEQYVKFVKEKKVYPIDPKKQPYQKLKIREKELVKVIGIKYQVGPPTLCGLKLAHIEPDTRKRTGAHFTIKYHDMADVIDFLVLRQHYDQSMQRQWKVGDRFRAAIDDAWWFGKITDHKPFQPEYPDSHFQCFSVAWDNGEHELMSPWDLEIINEDDLPEEEGGSVPIKHEEYREMIYTPMEEEWGKGEMDTECQRIILCMEQVMSLRIAELFVVPVDLTSYPTYPFYVPYPSDLTTIKNRLEMRFYRRMSALQWEVRLIEQNAAAFNYPGSAIVKYGDIVTRLLLEIIRDPDCTDAIALYNSMTQEEDGLPVNVDKVESEEEDEEGSKSSRKRKAADSSPRSAKKKRSGPCYDPKAWIGQCQELLQMMLDCQDSEPFRYPVDETIYVDYRNIISTPMDISTVREQLTAGMYLAPMELSQDIRLIFTNAKNYNTNKKSKIYGMMLRLSALFEDHIRTVVSDYKSALKYERQVKAGLKRRLRHKSRDGGRRSSSHKSKSSKHKASTSKHDDDDDDDDDDDQEEAGPSGHAPTASSRELNSSTNNKQSLHTPSTSSRTRCLPKRASARKVKEEDSSEAEVSDAEEKAKKPKGKRKKTTLRKKAKRESDTEEDSSDSEDADETDEEEKAKKPKGKRKKKTTTKKAKRESDTEEESSNNDNSNEEDTDETEEEEEEEEKVATRPKGKSKPARRPVKGKAKLKGKNKLTNGFTNKRSSPRKKPKVSYDEENEYEEEEVVDNKSTKKEEEESSASEKSNSDASGSSSSDSDSESESSEDKSDSSEEESPKRTRGAKNKSHSKRTADSSKTRKSVRRRTRMYSSDFEYGSLPQRKTRSQGKRTVLYAQEDTGEDSQEGSGAATEGSSDDAATTVSSRGRVRRLTQRARERLLGE